MYAEPARARLNGVDNRETQEKKNASAKDLAPWRAEEAFYVGARERIVYELHKQGKVQKSAEDLKG